MLKFIGILFCILTFNGWAQRCGGELYFRIYNNTERKIYPASNDTLSMNINPNDEDVGTGKGIDNVKLPASKLKIKSIKTEGNAGTASLSIIKLPYTSLLFRFSTGCYTPLKKISVINGKEKMILNLINIPREATILMDSIPFVKGEMTYDIEKIIRENKLNDYEMPPKSKFYLNYSIPYNLIKTETFPRSATFEIKNDTLYNYADSLKTIINSKGKVKIHKTRVTYYHNAWEMKMNSNLKRKHKMKVVTNLKRGIWTYYYQNYTLQLREREKSKIQRKIHGKLR